MDIFLDAKVWYLVSFLMFFGILWRFGKPAFLNFVDQRIEAIREEIETAENLRVEAQSMLAQYQRKHKDAVKDAQHIIDTAKQQAEQIQIQAEKDLDETIDRREKQLAERLERMEETAKEEIRQYAAALAMNTTSEIIAKELDKKTNDKLVNIAIQGAAENLH